MTKKSPWTWIPSLYFAQGIPYVIVMTVSVIMYKRMGISNTEIGFYTSWLYLPWVIKPIWSPVVDMLKTKRWWIITTQLLVGAGLAGVALTIPAPSFFKYTMAFFWLMAFSSATSDISADGFYMLGLDKNQQTYFVGIRSTAYRVAMIAGQGLLVMLAGHLETSSGSIPLKLEVIATTEMVSNDIPSSSQKIGDFIVSTSILKIPIRTSDSIDLETYNRINTENLANGFILEKEDQNKQKGNYGIISINLASQLDSASTKILNLNLKNGSNIFIRAGERLEFNSSNWNKKAWVIFQIDPKLTKSTIARFEGTSGNIPLAWAISFGILAVLFILFVTYHKFILPRPISDVAVISEGKNPLHKFISTFITFFKKDGIGMAILFLLTFRLGESQLSKIAAPFLLDGTGVGGLGLTTGDVGLMYGTVGVIALTLGGILGGLAASKHGLKYWIFGMTVAINLPNFVYVYLSYSQPTNMYIIASCIAIEQLGYGFGFTAYMLFMILFCEGKSKTAHYAICTGFMALGMMLPGMISGWIQDLIGYEKFFIWVVICTIPGYIVSKTIKIDPKFGIKTNNYET